MPRKTPKRPKLGQHFLADEAILARIAESTGVAANQAIVEIGPGRGALTGHLLERGAHVTAIEVDPDCVAALAKLDRASGQLDVVEQDILQTAFAAHVRDPPIPVVGNLPYYITSPILRAVYAKANLFTHATVLIQKEVAKRLCAQPKSRDYGYLTVLTQLHAAAELLFEVPPEAFRPPPRVDSAVVRLKFHHAPPPNEAFVKFAAQAFREPRKTLRNNLKGVYPRDQVQAQVPEFSRAEELSVDELKIVWNALNA